MTGNTAPVQAAKTSFKIIDKLRELDGAGVSKLADELDMPTSTIHDHLQTLVNEEYLLKEDGIYRVGVRFLELGEQARNRMKVFSVARPEINNLAKQTGEHANLMIEEHGWGVFLYKTRGENAVQLDTHPGMRVSLHTTAMGKAILAYRPQDEVEDIINQHGLSKVTENTITNRDTLFESLDEIRNRGYAYDDEERVKGMRCIAAPITDNHNQAIAALSVSGPKSRMPDASLNGELADMVQRAANVIQVNLTYS